MVGAGRSAIQFRPWPQVDRHAGPASLAKQVAKWWAVFQSRRDHEAVHNPAPGSKDLEQDLTPV
jgi:hypothetical protein